MELGVETKPQRDEFQRFIASLKDPAIKAEFQKSYDEMVAESKKKRSRHIKRGIRDSRVTKKKIKDQVEEKSRGGALVPVGEVRTYEKVRATPRASSEADDLKRREARNLKYIESLKRQIDKAEPDTPHYERLKDELKTAVKTQSEVHAEMKEAGVKPSAGAAKRAQTVRNQVPREEKMRRARMEAERLERERAERHRREFEERQEAQAQARADTYSRRAEEAQRKAEAQAEARDDIFSRRDEQAARKAEYKAQEDARREERILRQAELREHADARRAEERAQRDAEREEYAALRDKNVRTQARRRAMRNFRRKAAKTARNTAVAATISSKRQKQLQGRSQAGRRPTSMASRVPAAYREQEYSPGIHDTRVERVIAAGGVETVWFATTAVASAAMIASRKNDIAWAAGTGAVTFFVAGGARNDATIRDMALGAFSGAAAVLTIRLMGKLNRFQGQQ